MDQFGSVNVVVMHPIGQAVWQRRVDVDVGVLVHRGL